ncbi:MAG: hypothetical protein GC151_12485 [Betaproteobacteria bacterium]|nr:hypothetical protein [Betaproteobacteria bacterium]
MSQPAIPDPRFDRAREDVGNIVLLEHVNVTQPDQQLATLFYISTLGFTRDPYIMVGLENMWVNIGRNQMHLPSGNPQRIRATIGLVVPDLDDVVRRVGRFGPKLAGTAFTCDRTGDTLEVTCPWGNRFRVHAPAPEFGAIDLGMPYIEFDVPRGSAGGIARFYRDIMAAPSRETAHAGTACAEVVVGRDQRFRFRESGADLPPYDGHHVQIYIADFSGPYRRLLERGLVTRETDAHEWRFRDIVDPDSGSVLFTVEHEVRSMRHPLYGRRLVNRNPAQTNVAYVRGHDDFRGTC